MLRGHESRVYSVSYSPNGRRIVSGSDDHTVRVWDAENGTELAQLVGHEGPVHCVSYSPDGRRIVSGSFDNTVRVWDPKTGVALTAFCGHEGFVLSVSYSPDGRWIVSASRDKTIRVWDSGSDAVLATLRGHKCPMLNVSYSLDGRRIVSASSDRTVRVWDSYSGVELAVLHGYFRKIVDSGLFVGVDGASFIQWESDSEFLIWQRLKVGRLVLSGGFSDYRAAALAFETAITPKSAETPIAWYGTQVERLNVASTGIAWAGVEGRAHIQIIQLEGDV